MKLVILYYLYKSYEFYCYYRNIKKLFSFIYSINPFLNRKPV